MTSASIENYLKVIYQLQDAEDAVSTTALADALGVSAASATNMVKKLAALKLAEHSPYRGVALTRAGEKRALEMVRHHRLIELFLTETLGVPWDQVHAEAEKMEHVISEDLEERIATRLGNPEFDPHGDPIPTKGGHVPRAAQLRLTDLAIGETAYLTRARDQDSEHLRYLGSLGIERGARIVLVDRSPFEGPVKIRVGNREQLLSHQFAAALLVSRVPFAHPARKKRSARAIRAVQQVSSSRC